MCGINARERYISAHIKLDGLVIYSNHIILPTVFYTILRLHCVLSISCWLITFGTGFSTLYLYTISTICLRTQFSQVYWIFKCVSVRIVTIRANSKRVRPLSVWRYIILVDLTVFVQFSIMIELSSRSTIEFQIEMTIQNVNIDAFCLSTRSNGKLQSSNFLYFCDNR